MEKGTKVREGWDDMLKAVRDKNKQQPNGGAGKKQGSAYGGSKQKDDKPVKENALEITNEAAISTVAKAHGFVKHTSGMHKGSYKHPKTGETITPLGGAQWGHSSNSGGTIASYKHKDGLEKHLADRGYKKTSNESFAPVAPTLDKKYIKGTPEYKAYMATKKPRVGHPTNVKEKMDPVGKADADIDNDGDVDKSDKYLHNRRKAIKKSMGNKGETATMNPKMSTGSVKEATNAQINKVLGPTKNAAQGIAALKSAFKVNDAQAKAMLDRVMKEELEQVDELSQNTLRQYHGKAAADYKDKKNKASTATLSTTGLKTAQKRRVGLDRAANKMESKIRESLISVLEKKDAHTKGAISQPMDDNLSGAGAKKMKDDLTAKEKEKITDYDELGHDDATKAGRDGPSMKMRPNDNKQGDKKIVNPVDDVTKKAGYKTETFIDKISALYKSMLK